MIAALVTMLLSTTLLAAGPMYSSAVSVAGLRQLLAEASVEAGNVLISAGVPRSELDVADGQVSAELERLAGSTPAEISRFWTADTFALPGQGDQVRDLAVPGFAEGIERHATLVSGTWPADGAPGIPDSPTAAVEVAVAEPVATQIGLAVGDRLDLVSRRDEAFMLPVVIAAVFRIDDPRDPYWWSDQRMLEGVTVSSQYRTFGPFVMSRDDMLARAVIANVSTQWRLLPDYASITPDDLGGLRQRLAAFPERLRVAAGAYAPTVETTLGETLASAIQALLVSRTGMLLVMAQLALLGGYAILLTAGLLLDHRRVETQMLRSRGAGPAHLAGMAAVEGFVLALPAVALGPLCALVGLTVFDRFGPMAQIGVTAPIRVTPDAYLAAGVCGLACVLLLAAPALLSARSSSSAQPSASRAETRPLAARLGIDIALLVVAGIALWQLRLYGAPLTRTLQGTLGPDPLLVAAPALGLLLGAVIATRVLPRLAEVAQGVLGRGRGLVGALGSSQLARRPLRYTRSALMLMLAMSIGVFAASYAATWSDSQRSQADHQVGADVRVLPDRSVVAMPDLALGSAYAALPGVQQLMPVERFDVQLSPTDKATVLALDARLAPGIVRFRADQAQPTLDSLLPPLAQHRPTIAAPTIPRGSTSITITPEIEVRGLQRFIFNRVTGNTTRRDEDPSLFERNASVGASIAVLDERGLVHRFRAPLRPLEEVRQGVQVPIVEPFASSLALLSLDLSIAIREELVVTDASVAIIGVSAMSPASETAVSLDLGTRETWQTTWLDPIREPITPASTAVDGFGLALGGGAEPREFFTVGPNNDPVVLSLQPVAIASALPAEVPVVVSRALLGATALGPGDTFRVNPLGAQRQLRIVGVVDAFPTVDAATPLMIVDLPSLTQIRFATAHDASGGGNTAELRRPDEWWLDLGSVSADGGADSASVDDISLQLTSRPFKSTSVTTAVGRLRSLVSDPVALGIIGALGLGAIAAGLFALIGLALGAAVSARQRQGEFALVRALGLSRRQLTAWLWLENGSLAVISVLVGAALGALISWVVLPSVTVTTSGLPPTPPVVVNLPLTTIAILAALAAVALAGVVFLIAASLRRLGIGNVLRLSEE